MFTRLRLDTTVFLWFGQTLPFVFLGAAIVIGSLLALVVANLENPFLLFPLLLASMGAITIIFKPEWGLMGLAFMIYTRLSDILIDTYGIPSLAKVYIPFLALVVIIRILLFKERPNGLNRSLIIFAYGGMGLLSFFYAQDTNRVGDALGDFLKDAIIVFIILALLQRGTTLRRVIWVLLTAGIFLGTLSVIQQLTGTFTDTYWGFAQANIMNIVGESSGYRIGGPGLGPNAYGQFMLILVPFALDRFWHEKNRLLRALATWALAACILTIFFTFSRGVFLGLVVVMAIMFLQYPPSAKTILLTLVASAILIQYIPDQYADRLLTLRDLVPSSEGLAEEEVSFRGRLSENLSGLMMFSDHPFIGVGLGNFKTHYQTYSRQIGLDPRREVRSAHSLYLQIAAEFGMMGLGWFIILQTVTSLGLRRARQDFDQAGLPDYSSLTLAFGASIIGFLVTSVFKHMAHPRYVWLLYGIALAMPVVAQYELKQYLEVAKRKLAA